MPTSAVYQPTTVTYEQQPNEQRWNCPISYYARRAAGILDVSLWVRVCFCIFGVCVLVLGISLVIAGGIQYTSPVTPYTPKDYQSTGVSYMIAGSVVFCVGVLLTVFGYWVWRPKFGIGKESPTGGAAGLTALNPSTDPLVAAQYAPVRDAPPAPDDEMRNLMDNKECLSSAEESDKMLDGRPSVA